MSNPIQTNLKSIRNYVQEIEHAFQSPLHPHTSQPRPIKWCLPSIGKLKLNTDGCFKRDPSQAGYGGLLRDEVVTWIWGYYGKLRHYSSLEAELWAIYRGITILFQNGKLDVEIETDFEQTINLIQNGPSHTLHIRPLLKIQNSS
ncbi:hypothetical protein ACSBR2_017983 [Camellia fascicularis]